MGMTRQIAALAVLTAATVATACTAERAIAPQTAGPSVVTMTAAPQIPLLYVVDGVKYQRDQVPLITNDQVYAVQVIKGRAALKQYGPEASYGVVVITTKQGASPRS